MRLRAGLIVATLVVAGGCDTKDPAITIRMAEAAGFQKKGQQLFQLIGADDGWGGTWEGETVELYQFSAGSTRHHNAFETAADPGNLFGWVDRCVVKNTLMVSKGRLACDRLRALANR